MFGLFEAYYRFLNPENNLIHGFKKQSYKKAKHMYICKPTYDVPSLEIFI